MTDGELYGYIGDELIHRLMVTICRLAVDVMNGEINNPSSNTAERKELCNKIFRSPEVYARSFAYPAIAQSVGGQAFDPNPATSNDAWWHDAMGNIFNAMTGV